jgi:hypothetical protein
MNGELYTAEALYEVNGEAFNEVKEEWICNLNCLHFISIYYLNKKGYPLRILFVYS